MNGDRTSHVRVGVRVRPLTSKEIQQGGKVSLSILPPSSITITSQKTFTYDAVFDAETNQDDLYSSVSSSLLDSFVDGYNATVSICFPSSVHVGTTVVSLWSIYPCFFHRFLPMVRQDLEKHTQWVAKRICSQKRHRNSD